MTIPTITTLPVAPARTDAPATFVTRADAFLAAIVVMQGELNTTIGAMNTDIAGVNTDATTASNAATSAAASAAAAQSASNATAWVSGQTYAAGATVYSLINYKSYRAITGTSGTTDPSASADWTALGYGLPSQSGNADKFLQTDGTNESWQDVPASGGTYTATSSGTIANGDKIVVNTDGTISAVSGAENPNLAGAVGTFTTGTCYTPSVAYDKANDRVVIFYNANGSLAALAATLASDGTFTFGSEVQVYSASGYDTNVCYDENRGQVIFMYRKGNGVLQARAGTVDPSNNSIVVGTPSDNSQTSNGDQFFNAMVYNSTEQHIAVAYWEYNSYRIIILPLTLTGTVGVNTNITWGTYNYATPSNQNSWYVDIAWDPDKELLLLFWRDDSNSNYATCRAGTWLSTYYDFNPAETVVNSSSCSYERIIYSPTGKCFVAFYNDSSNYLKVNPIVVGLDRAVTVGTQYNINSYAIYPQIVNNSQNDIVLTYRDGNVSGSAKAQAFTIDANQVVTHTTPFEYVNTNTDQAWHGAYDPDNNYVLSIYADGIAGGGEAVAVRTGFTSTNLTQNNWIGVSNAAYANGVSAEIKTRGSVITNSTFKDIGTILGAAATADTAASATAAISYDSNSDRYLAVYRHGSTNYGTCVVIQVDSSNNLTFGTLTTFASFIVKPNLDVAFDSNVNKFVIAYANNTPTSLARVAIIDPSNNSVTFGTEATVTTETSIEHAISFDSYVNKFLISYGRYSPAGGHAKVAYIDSGANTLSFGAEATFDSTARARYSRSAFDSNINKIIISFIPHPTTNGSAIVGTINTGTNAVTFGSASIFASDASINSSRFPQVTYNSNANKSVISYENTSGTNHARIATINSGTSAITYGTLATIDGTGNAASYQNNVAIGANGVLFCYQKDSAGKYKIATISGTNLTMGDEVQFVSGSAYYFAPFYNPTNDQVVFNYAIGSTTGGVATSFSRNLSAGTSYLINFDGTITTTANNFTVTMGTALNSTTVFTKGV